MQNAENDSNARGSRLVPICGWCKSIRTGADVWEKLEIVLTREGFGEFTHSMCPDCAETIFTKKVYLQSYQQICKAISASLTLSEVLDHIVTNVVKVMNVKASLLRLLNRQTSQLEVAAYHGLSKRYAGKGPVQYDKSIEDALAGKPVSIYDILADPNARYRAEAEAEGIRSIISVPLRFKDDVIGVLRMYSAEPMAYSDEDLRFMAAIAEQAAIAIMNARFFEKKLSRERRYLNLFQEVAAAVGSTLDIENVLDMIVNKVPEAMDLDSAAIHLLDEDGFGVELAALHGISSACISEVLTDVERRADDLRAEPSVIEDREPKGIELRDCDPPVRSILSLPVKSGNRVIGVLRVFGNQPRKFSADEINFASSLALQCGTAIENARMFHRLAREARYLKAIHEVAMAVGSAPRTEDVLQVIVRTVPKIMNLKAATIRLLDAEGKKLVIAASHGLSQKYLNKGVVDAARSVGEALSGIPVMVYDVVNDPRIIYPKEAKEEGIGSMLVVPIMLRGDVIGEMRLYCAFKRDFSEDEVDVATVLAEQSGIAIENARAREARG
ncbi:MAG: GAF domain-containing protein [Nitrospirae bacterium]|nr:GAF domain-containing protein [Nitrospirota bacterium]